MCGIIGYTGSREAASILLDGLAALEYRGYDSAGISVFAPTGDIAVKKASGKLESLFLALEGVLPLGQAGVGHTRWATHGEPNQVNSHPHVDCHGGVVVVHNGIVENYLELKRDLIEQGHAFSSDTDSEVIPYQIESLLVQGLDMEEATRQAALKLMGAHAAVVMSREEPDKIIALRIGNAGGIVVGYGDEEMLVASDLPAVIPHTRRVVFLDAGEMATVTPISATYKSLRNGRVEKVAKTIPYDPIAAAKGDYEHFMLKEISEQPQAITATMRGRVSFETQDVFLEDIGPSDSELKAINL